MLNEVLTDVSIKRAIRTAASATKPKKLFDGKGLYLLLKPAGAALWRFKFVARRTAQGKSIDNSISFGAYPDVSLKLARERRDEARRQLAQGIDPSEARKEAKLATANTFGDVAEEYVTQQEGRLKPRTVDKARWQLREFVNPSIGKKPINEIGAQELLACLRKIEARGKIETAHKTKELVGRVFMYGISTGRCERNVAADLKLALKPRPNDHLAALTDPAEVGELLRAIDRYPGQPATHAALKLLPHVFLRSSELRFGRWSELDLDGAIWRIPADRMKSKRDHLVPLSRQSLGLLKDLKEITGSGEFLFPAIGPKRRPISENTLGNALHGLGYASDVHVPHGFRTTASTLLHELGHESRDIELQLAHSDTNKVRGIYNRSERLKERTRMLQQWSDYLDTLRTSGEPKVVPIKQRA